MNLAALNASSVLFAVVVAAVAAVYFIAIDRLRPPYARTLSARVFPPIGFGLLALALVEFSRTNDWGFPGWDWVLVCVLGAGVAMGELVSRYRDAPMRAVLTIPALVYMLINAGAGAGALAISQAVGWSMQPTQSSSSAAVHWPLVLASGLGAMSLLRSAVFKVRTGGQDVAVGPTTFLDSIVDATDRAVDRLRAQDRAWAVGRAVQQIDKSCYPLAVALLPRYCLCLVQNLDDSDRKAFMEEIAQLTTDSEPNDRVRLLRAGLTAMNYFGTGVLEAAIRSLKEELVSATHSTTAAARDAEGSAGRVRQLAHALASGSRGVAQALRERRDVPLPVIQAADKSAEHADVLARAADAAKAQAVTTVVQAEAAEHLAASATGGTTPAPTNGAGIVAAETHPAEPATDTFAGARPLRP